MSLTVSLWNSCHSCDLTIDFLSNLQEGKGTAERVRWAIS
ncbi:hypothetical protein JMJ77_0005076, partial [Colletotrichum scovillei]